MTTGFDFPDNYDEIVATRKAALAARQIALLDYDSTPTEEEAIDLIRDAADSSSGYSGINTLGSFVYNNYGQAYAQVEYTYNENSELFALDTPEEYARWEDNEGWFVGPNLLLPAGYYDISCLADVSGDTASLGFVIGADIWYFPSDTSPTRNYTQTFWLDEETNFGMYMYPSDGVSLLYVRLSLVVRKLG